MRDKRIDELEELAREEGITLPLPADLIVFFEKSGKVVDLITGKVMSPIGDIRPTRTGRTIAHLLSHEVGEVAL